jgi:hypothetical protein
MTASVLLAPLPKQRFCDNNGNPLAGGKLFTYAAGTTTKQNSYTDATGATPNTNPVILDSRGESSVWLDQTLAYKVVLAPATDTDPPTNPIWTIDNIPVSTLTLLSSASSGQGDSLIAVKASAAGSVLRTQHDKNADSIHIKDFGAKCDGVTVDTAAITNAMAAAQATNKSVEFSGTPLVDTKLTVPSGLRLFANAGLGGCWLYKKASMTGEVLILADYSEVSGISVYGQPGSTGDVIRLLGVRATFEEAIIDGGGTPGDGIRVGTKFGESHTNCNTFRMRSVWVSNCKGWGINVHDATGPTIAPDCNAGRLADCFTSSCGTATTGAQASFIGNVMNCTTAPSTGTFQVGSIITAAGVPMGTMIISTGTGIGGLGTYNLSQSVGTIGIEAVTGSNGGGINIGNAIRNVIDACLNEQNNGPGLLIGSDVPGAGYRCYDNMVVGGDVEQNIGADLLFGGQSVGNGYIGFGQGNITNNGFNTYEGKTNSNIEADYLPVVYIGAAVATVDSVVLAGTTLTLHTIAPHTLSTNDYVYLDDASGAAAGGFKVTTSDGSNFQITIRKELNYPWVPIQTGAFSAQVFKGCAPSTVLGHYRINDGRCVVSFNVVLSTKIGTGSVRVALPYRTRIMGAGFEVSKDVRVANTNGSFSTAGDPGILITQDGRAYAEFTKANGLGLTPAYLIDTDINNNTEFTGSFEYWT